MLKSYFIPSFGLGLVISVYYIEEEVITRQNLANFPGNRQRGVENGKNK
jgi:hypothetical protein